MDIQNNIARFETELAKVQRPGMDKLLEYIQKSDFYKVSASTEYHLAAPSSTASTSWMPCGGCSPGGAMGCGSTGPQGRWWTPSRMTA